MSRAVWGGVGVVVALAGTALVGSLSRVPYTHDAGTDALLRLAWRARSVRVQVCRHRTAEELAKLPAHMREDEVCERQLLPYRLRLTVDGTMASDEIVHASGARQDRPLYVFRQVPLRPGLHHISVRFDRQGSAPMEPPEEHPEVHAQSRSAPPTLELDTTLNVSTRSILLLTYDEDRRRLVLRGS